MGKEEAHLTIPLTKPWSRSGLSVAHSPVATQSLQGARGESPSPCMARLGQPP